MCSINLSCIRTIFDCSAHFLPPSPFSPEVCICHWTKAILTLIPIQNNSLYLTQLTLLLQQIYKLSTNIQLWSTSHLLHPIFYALSAVDKGEPSYPWIPHYASLTPPEQKRHPVLFCPSSQQLLSSYEHCSLRNKSSGISGLDALVTGRMLQYRLIVVAGLTFFSIQRQK